MVRFLRLLNTTVFLLLFVFSVLGQDQTIKQINLEGDTIELSAIPLTQITANLENDYNTLSELSKINEEDVKIDKFDSLYKNKTTFLKEKKLIFEENKANYSPREVDNKLREWGSYQKIGKDWNELLTENIKEIEQHVYTIQTLKKVWNLTSELTKQTSAPQSVLNSVLTIQSEINKTEDHVINIQNKLLQKQSDLSNLSLVIKEVTVELEEIKDQQKSDLFTFETPIWAVGDSVSSQVTFREYFEKSITEDVNSVSIFYQSNRNTIYLHLVLFFLIWLTFFLIQKQSVVIDEDENEAKLQKAQHAISRHGVAAFIISVFISIWLYPEVSSVIRDVIGLLYIIIALSFIPKHISQKLRPLLYGILALYFIDQIQLIFPSTTFTFRILLLAEALLAGWVLHSLLSKKGKVYKDLESRFKVGFIFNVLKIFYIFLGLSIVGNIIGIVYPAIILSDTVYNALISLIILILVVVTLSWTSAILLRTKFLRRSNFIKDNWRLVEKRASTVIYIIAVYLWVKSVLRSLNFLDGIQEWLLSLYQTTWKVGEKATIELGGILWFLIVVILTIIIYRVIKTILTKELYPRVKLPRGVPGAISMIVGYIVVAYGIFLALISAGVNLSQFGLIAGALGVGIGFGLQNIVANFIAGLVLAFERPIQVGDTIEAGTVMGDVTEIGVRACTIRTYDGSEVMVPNGNLIGNDVTNWTLSDRKKRRDIFVSVAYGNNPHEVIEVLRKVAEAHPNVLQVPAPWILFDGFGDSALNFRVRIWTAMDVGLTTKSDVAMNIYDALSDAGIQIPFPQQDLHIKSVDPSVENVFDPGNTKLNKKK